MTERERRTIQWRTVPWNHIARWSLAVTFVSVIVSDRPATGDFGLIWAGLGYLTIVISLLVLTAEFLTWKFTTGRHLEWMTLGRYLKVTGWLLVVMIASCCLGAFYNRYPGVGTFGWVMAAIATLASVPPVFALILAYAIFNATPPSRR